MPLSLPTASLSLLGVGVGVTGVIIGVTVGVGLGSGSEVGLAGAVGDPTGTTTTLVSCSRTAR